MAEMASSVPGARRLSTAFDNFRSKVRKARIDSLLSPPKPDSGSPSGCEGVAHSSDPDHGTKERRSGSEHAEHVEFALPSDVETIAGSETENERVENRRIASALADFKAEWHESYDAYDDLAESLSSHTKAERQQMEEHGSSSGSLSTGPSAASMTTSRSDNVSGDSVDMNTGPPLERQGLREYQTQVHVQTEPQTYQQGRLQSTSTYSSLDKILSDAGWNMSVQPHCTVDGLRLDASPLVRHTGTAAPPQTQLQGSPSINTKPQGQDADDDDAVMENQKASVGKCSSAERSSSSIPQYDTTGAPAASSSSQRPKLGSWFSSSSSSGHDSHTVDTDQQCLNKSANSQHQVASNNSGLNGQEDRSSTPSPTSGVAPRSFTSVNDTQAAGPELQSETNLTAPVPAPEPQCPLPPVPQVQINYSHTPPPPPAHRPSQPHRLPTSTYTSLCNAHAISHFHAELCDRLHRGIETGRIPAHQIPVAERIRRLSDTRVARGFNKVGRKMSHAVGQTSGSLVANTLNSVGVDWREVAEHVDRERGGYGRASAGMLYYGAGFV